MDYKSIPLNTIPSPEDKRDFPISKLVAQVNVFPDEFIIPYNHNILDQKQIGSCVSHSIEGYCRSTTEEKQTGKYQLFSVGFRYGMRDSDDYCGEGMCPREALDSSLKYGSVPYNVFPYNEDYPSVKARIEKDKDRLLKIAEPYKISAYCGLHTVDEIKNALMQLGMVTACIPVYESFYQTNSNGIVKNPNTNEKLHGYHEISLSGWRKDNRWIVLNSWSSNWGDIGKCYIPFDFPFVEYWSITDNIVPHPEPEPEKQKYWRIQLGAYSTKERAINAQKKMFDKTGWKSYVTYIKPYYKLQFGAYINKVGAEFVKSQLKNLGYDSFIVYY
ncbi:MAG: SPOR domain-containing protein [Clostridium sp.]|uniref:C1 family peptidase n=1 Tax=Clostridium sp. TaxID=1506 RepID=UPI0025BA0BAF|nr:C1 family peptidase [Clostridium sp.]MCE5220044.1 SPOR domain-containing protein [Clostridium sp.]